ncbi:MAG: hypothetical protein HY275_01730 [Gemmatimonadetes bacterium]|nr:hypothetical protein [Gemmatimonadota bacterium]
MRGTAALLVSFAGLLVAASMPRATALARSYDRLGEERLTERPRGDFAVGLFAFPVVDHPTPPGPLAHDLALADTMAVDALLVEIAPTVRAGALDSLAAVLEEMRRDSLVVSIAPALDAREPPGVARDRMLVALERAARRLQPDLVFAEPMARGDDATDAMRRRWFELVRTATRRGGSRARVLPVVRARDAERSWFLWADSAAGGMALVLDATDGGEALHEALRTASAWLALPPRGGDGTRLAWALGPRTAPALVGEWAQARAVWGTLAWGTRTPGLAGLIVGPTADYATVSGLRDAGDRPRAAQLMLVRAVRALQASAR